MRKTILNKTASMLALIMLVSMMVPVLAFADANFNVKTGTNAAKYDYDGTVTGQVYFTGGLDYNTVGNSVYLSVYSASGTYLTVVNATYSNFDGSNYYYDLSGTVTATTYDPIIFKYLYSPGPGEAVTDAVYQSAAPCTSNCGGNGGGNGGGGGGGGGGGNGATPQDGVIDVTVGNEVAADALKKALGDNVNVTVKVKGDSAVLPASALVGAKAGATITISNGNGTYVLPLSVLKLDDLAKALGITVADLKIKVEIKKVTGDAAGEVADAVNAVGGKALTDAVDFSVVAVGKDGKTIAIHSFGSTYVERTLPLNAAVNAKKVTAVRYDPSSKTVDFVPAVFGANEVTMKSNSNSIYIAIESDKSFTDIGSVLWAQDDIELLASKLIVAGVSETEFAPDRNITRAEFAALVVRSLGLNTTDASTTFSDVSATAWYAAEVAAAADAGIVSGYNDGTFRPNANITRQELAALVVRAQNFAGKKAEAANAAQVLAPFKDAAQVSAWAKNELAAAIEAKIVYGMTEDTIDAQGNATRAQATAMLKRFLSNAEFIN